MNEFISDILSIGEGIPVTLGLLTGGILIGLTLGVLFSVLRYQGMGIVIINRLISVIRGTPLLLQLSLVYFSIPTVTGIKLNVITAGILTFGLNSSAYIAEIFRAGLESLSKGQFEAGKALEIPTVPLWRDIILPQVIRKILPALVNEIITLTKETALIATLGGMDIMRFAQIMASQHFTYFRPLFIAGLYYYSLILLIEFVGRRIEQRVSYDHH